MADNDEVWVTRHGIYINGTKIVDAEEYEHEIARGINELKIIIRSPLSVLTGKAADDALMDHELKQGEEAEAQVKPRAPSSAAQKALPKRHINDATSPEPA